MSASHLTHQRARSAVLLVIARRSRTCARAFITLEVSPNQDSVPPRPPSAATRVLLLRGGEGWGGGAGRGAFRIMQCVDTLAEMRDLCVCMRDNCAELNCRKL